MKLLVTFLLLFTLAASAANIDAFILNYIHPGEDYSTFELLQQNSSGTSLANILVLVNDTPTFILYSDGRLVEDPQIIWAVSGDYVTSRETGTIGSTQEAVAAEITLETASRKTSGLIRKTSEDATSQLVELRKTFTQISAALSPSVKFTKIGQQLGNLETNASKLKQAQNLDELNALNASFYSEFTPFKTFMATLLRVSPQLMNTTSQLREARRGINEKTVSVGRDNLVIIESQQELNQIDSLLAIEVNKIENLTPPNEAKINEAHTRSTALAEKINHVKGNEGNLVTLALVILLILIVLAGVVFYFKKLKDKQKLEDLPPQ